MIQHAVRLIGKRTRFRHDLIDGTIITADEVMTAEILAVMIETGVYHLELEANGIWSDRHDPVAVYVPTCERMKQIIRPMSGIVGRLIKPPYPMDARAEAGKPSVHLYYQDTHGEQSNIQTYADTLVHATGRMLGNYPTVARCFCRIDQVLNIGIWDGVSLHITRPHELVKWMRWDALYERELHRSDRRTS